MSVVWKAELTAEMVSHLTDADLAELLLSLDEAVMTICYDFEVN